MKIIIDPYRGGNDIGKEISGQYEKNILLNLSKYMSEQFNKKGLETELVRTNDVSLTDDERNSIINEIKTQEDIIIQNRLSEDNEFDIVYPLRNSDSLPSIISSNLESRGINVDKYFQRRLPTNTTLDYYNVIRNTKPNETIIIEYKENNNNEEIINIIVDTISEYINKQNIYTVKSGDTLYQIAIKYNITVDEIKKTNNLISNSLNIGQQLKIPIQSVKDNELNQDIYTVKSGDSLYQIAIKYNTTVEEIKKLNNLTSSLLNIGQQLKIPTKSITQDNNKYDIYIVKSGDTLYQIAKNYNITVNNLKKLNNLSSNILNIGQTIKVPKKDEEYIIYTVKSGDSLYQIAKKYNVSVSEIKNINNLTSNLLSINQELKLPR